MQVMKMSKVHTILVITMLLFGGVVFLSVANPVSAQTTPPTATPTPNPTVVALEERIHDLENEVNLLNQQRETDKQSLEVENQKLLLPVYVWLAILSALGVSSAVGAWAWIRKFIEDTKKQAEEDIRKTLDKAFYNADPLYYPLYVPMNGFETEVKRLRKLGFRDLREYGGLREAILKGVIVVRIPGDNFSKNQQDVDHAEAALGAFENFVIENNAHQKAVAFILYITGGHLQKANELTNKYDNVVIANMPVTVAGHVYALVRGLTAIENKKEDA